MDDSGGGGFDSGGCTSNDTGGGYDSSGCTSNNTGGAFDSNGGGHSFGHGAFSDSATYNAGGTYDTTDNTDNLFSTNRNDHFHDTFLDGSNSPEVGGMHLGEDGIEPDFSSEFQEKMNGDRLLNAKFVDDNDGFGSTMDTDNNGCSTDDCCYYTVVCCDCTIL